MARPRIHVGGALVAFGIVVGAAISLNVGGGADEELETKPTATGTGPIVFYSGDGEAGIGSADQYSGWEFVEDNRLGGFHWSDWNGDDPATCNPDRADDFPSDRGLHVLVGYSSGRQGVVYFLRAAEDRWGEIDTIYLLDPGDRTNMSSGCDSRMPELPTVYLERWLSRDANRRLIIVSSKTTNSDAREGLNKFYLGSMFRSSQGVADRTLVCIDKANTSHRRVDDVFMSRVAYNHDRNCPEGTYQDVIRAAPAPTTAPGSAQVPPAARPTSAQPTLTTSTTDARPTLTTPPTSAQPLPTTSTTDAQPTLTTRPHTPTTAPTTSGQVERVGTVNGCNTYGQNCEGNPIFRDAPPQNYDAYLANQKVATVANGTQLLARCWSTGKVVWNYAALHQPVDYGPNPYDSTIYFYVRAPNGQWGFIPDTYFVRDKTNKLGLPSC